MERTTLGAIDIGSNAIRLFINYVEHSSSGKVTFKKAAFIRVPIRLGEDVFTQGYIGEKKLTKLIEAMKSFMGLMRTFSVKSYRACATSAMREASNGAEVVAQIAECSGINIEIITGQEEAETIFNSGGAANLMGRDGSYIYVDVGGGSTEITIYSNHKRVISESFPLGTVRTISDAVDKATPERFKKWLEDEARPLKPIAIIGSGGNINKVYKLLGKHEGDSINYVELKILYNQIKDMSYDERVRNMGLNLYRADVIEPAMKIFLTVAKACRINEILVPRVGLGDGIIQQLYAKMEQK
ncbi:MAG: hypothetical protein SNJ33_02015 [Rikenellaceae bacterium]